MPGFWEFWGNLFPADVFAFQASGILGKFEPGSTLATSDAKSIGRDQISPKFLAPSLPIDARILGILGKFDPCRCFRISGFRNFGEIRAWRHFSNLGCENIGRDQISPKFLAPSLPIDARILGILGKFVPCRCFCISGFRHFGEIRAWQHFSNLRCEKHRQGL